jgi:hypothetical protein
MHSLVITVAIANSGPQYQLRGQRQIWNSQIYQRRKGAAIARARTNSRYRCASIFDYACIDRVPVHEAGAA